MQIDTTDLTSYIPGYDDYCESNDKYQDRDNSDEIHEEMMFREEIEER